MKKSILLIITTIILTASNLSAQNLLNGAEGIAYSTETKCYYVSNATDGKIIKVDEDENQTILYSGLAVPMGVHLIGNKLYVASNEDPYGKINCIDINTGELLNQKIISGALSLAHMDYDPISASLYLVNQMGKLYKINPETLDYETIATTTDGLLNGSQTVVVNQEKNEAYIFSWPSAYIRIVNLDNNTVTNGINPGTYQIIDCCKDAQNNVYFTTWSGNKIYHLNPDCTSNMGLFSSSHDQPAGLCYNPDKNIIAVANYGGNTIEEITLVTGIGQLNQQSKDFRLYPNPVSEHLNLEILQDLNQESLKCIINGIDGKKFLEQKIKINKNSKNRLQFNCSSLISGNYILQIYDNSNLISTKSFIKN